LDPFFGVYHSPRFGRAALALDLCEEFRPLVADSVVVRAFNTGEVGEEHFVSGLGRVGFTKPGMQSFLNAYERRVNEEVTHPRFGYKASYRRIFETQSRVLAAVLLNEFDDYAPMVTR
jgi:CRISPR-associated protein Cas1